MMFIPLKKKLSPVAQIAKYGERRRKNLGS
jgi:hypothetical protein